jgi:hypothetical protein
MIAIQHNSIWLINSILLWLYKNAGGHITLSPSHASLSMSFTSWSVSFSREQSAFAGKCHLASHSYLTYHYEFRHTFSNSPVTNELVICALVNHLHDAASVQDRNHSGRPSELSDNTGHSGHFQYFNIKMLFSDFNIIYFLTYKTCVRNGTCDFFISLFHTHFRFLYISVANHILSFSEHGN